MSDVLMKVSGKSIRIIAVQFTRLSYNKVSLIVKGVCEGDEDQSYSLTENYVMWDLKLSCADHNLFKELFSPVRYKFKKQFPNSVNEFLCKNHFEIRLLCNHYVPFVEHLMSEGISNRTAISVVDSLIATIKEDRKRFDKEVHDKVFYYESKLFNDLISFDEIYSFVYEHSSFDNCAL